MTAGLQEQRVGENGDDDGNRQRACQHVLRAVQQDAHGKSALLFRVDRNGLRATAAAAAISSSSSMIRLGTFLHLMGLLL
jgi:hypothetical protein